MKRVWITICLACLIVAAGAVATAPARAATQHLDRHQVRQFGYFLSAFTNEHVTSFERSPGPSNLVLVHFAVWYTFQKDFAAVVTDDQGYGYIADSIVDSVDRRFFGRTATAREDYPNADIAYVDGAYQFMPAMGDPVHRAKVTRAVSSGGRVWTVHLQDQSRPEWVLSGGGWTTVGRYRATVRVTGTARKPHYTLLAWRKL